MNKFENGDRVRFQFPTAPCHGMWKVVGCTENGFNDIYILLPCDNQVPTSFYPWESVSVPASYVFLVDVLDLLGSE